jgi:hypothetical protein
MEKRNVLENQLLDLKKVANKTSIPFLGGRPDRVTIISEDEIIDLKINLNITTTVDEFLALI